MSLLTVSKRNHPAVKIGDVTFSLNMPENNNWMDWQGRWWVDFGDKEATGYFEQEDAPPENIPNEAVRIVSLAAVIAQVAQNAPALDPILMMWVLFNLGAIAKTIDQLKQEYLAACGV